MRSIWQTFEKRVDMTRYVPAQDIINSAQGGISSHKIDPRSLKTPKISRCAGLRARFARPAARASLAQLSPRKKGLNHVPLAHPDRGSSQLGYDHGCVGKRYGGLVMTNVINDNGTLRYG
jgi:hypothetical protein